MDSNHRSWKQQIYSLPPLATRELFHIKFKKLVNGLEPLTCWLQISCSTNWATPAQYQTIILKTFRSWWTDSNPWPADYKSAALPTELHQHLIEATGVEPAASWSQTKHSTKLSYASSFLYCSFDSFLIIHYQKPFVNTFLKKIFRTDFHPWSHPAMLNLRG